MLIKNLAGIFTGTSFRKNLGRTPRMESSDFISGPIDLAVSPEGKISKIAKNLSDSGSPIVDGTGLVATSSFFDSHTHTLFAGERSSEFFKRWSGDSYTGIAQKGGGIAHTMQLTGSTADEDLMSLLMKRIQDASKCGITHLEIKTGYAPTAGRELRLLRLLKKLRETPLPVETYATFLGLHALPKDRDEKSFVDEMISILPTIEKEKLASFIDAFPEKGFFSLEESLRFAREGMKHGLRPKIHADELSPLGSAENFSKLGALSVDHLQKISTAGLSELAESRCVATLLPATSFFLGLEYAPADKLLKAGARVALATDFNPGTAPDFSPQLTMRLAATQFRMDPSQIFCAFTYNAAAALGIEERTGTVQEGLMANLCLWKCSFPSALEEIVVSGLFPKAVVFRGRPIFPQEL